MNYRLTYLTLTETKSNLDGHNEFAMTQEAIETFAKIGEILEAKSGKAIKISSITPEQRQAILELTFNRLHNYSLKIQAELQKLTIADTATTKTMIPFRGSLNDLHKADMLHKMFMELFTPIQGYSPFKAYKYLNIQF